MEEKSDTHNTQTRIDYLLRETSKCLARFLERVLPSISANWWNEVVLDVLSDNQRQWIKNRGISSLTSLDLADLLRILDQNWHGISSQLELSHESQHFAKEMRTVLNRWAHVGSDELPLDDTYRDLDTLQRFCKTINADENLIREIEVSKTSILGKRLPGTSQEKEITSIPPEKEKDSISLEFSPGQMVVLKSDPSTRGAIVKTIHGNPENRFVVFANGTTRTYYESQIKAYNPEKPKSRFLPHDEFHSRLTALQIRHPGVSTLYSLNAARVDFIPYQFRPVLRFIRSDRPRLLVADGVGVGKTIEAGLILRELQARRNVGSILIICPRPLITERKWELEMKRFEEEFVHLDGKTLRYCINQMDMEGVWPERYQRVIVPYSLLDGDLLHGVPGSRGRKRRKGVLDLDPKPSFDLVIVDEAHHVRNQNTLRHQAVKFFCEEAEAAVFLTATPIQLGNQDLFVLLNMLRPDLVLDQESFRHMAEPNPFINQAVLLARAQKTGWVRKAGKALDQAAATPWGQSILKDSPEFKRTRKRLSKNNMDQKERVQLITDLEELHTFSGIINRTRRCDIENFTIRKPETVIVEFTPEQKRLHDELLCAQAEIFRKLHGDINVNFMMTTIRRQAASCLFGLIPLLQGILTRHFKEQIPEETDGPENISEIILTDDVKSRIDTVLKTATDLDPEDPKLEALRKIINDKQAMPNNKIMLFSSFRHTLDYLYENLKNGGLRVGMIRGSTPDEKRVLLRRRFESLQDQDDSLDILLFSEIGCEGLDYQFCDCIVNYDLPWNPMRVEQRIGRIDRKGQKNETVAIVNLITPGTVDADIYERCLTRIGVFRSALGGSEEILGEITQEIRNIAENFSLSDEERGEQLQQLADNKIRLIQEQEEMEEKQLELFGIRLPQDRIKKEVEHASSFWLSPTSILRLVTIYLQKRCGEEQEFILGEKQLKTLRLSQESRKKLLEDLQKLPREKTTTYREWENWLKGDSPHFSITFESDCASQNPKAAFVMPLHPLVKQASAIFDAGKNVFATLKVNSNEVPEGKYEFAIYKWQFHGIREDMVLQPVTFSQIVTEHLSRLLETAKTDTVGNTEIADTSPWEALDADHYKLWHGARAKHQSRTLELARYRKESLSTSHNARISLLREQLGQATNERIQKMRRSQIETADADYGKRLQELDIAVERAEITAEPVAYGTIQIEGIL